MTTIVLPERDDMLARLTAVDDTPHTVSGLYPMLLEHAGQDKTPEAVALMFILASGDYTEGQPPASRRTLDITLPLLVAAIVDDEDARRETLEVIRSAQAG